MTTTIAEADRELAVSVRDLRKSYGEHPAVQGIDLEIRKGEIFALLGPNGAGKTTTVEILEGYRHRDSGDVAVLGLDPRAERNALKARIGIVLQSTGVDRYLSVAETITMFGRYFAHPRPTDEVLELVGLTEKRDERVLRLSGGQQRRLDVAIALVGDPELLFLDEPTTGFDPTARREAWEVVKSLAALGKTVLLTTHYMDEAQYLADQVAVIAGGKIVALGPPSTLGGRDSAQPIMRLPLPAGVVPPESLGASERSAGVWEIPAENLTAKLAELSNWSTATGADLNALEIIRPTLEDVYLALTGADHGPVAEPEAPTRRRRRR